jgi:hypothetical protein
MLPDGWTKYTTEDGKEYYHHAGKNLTQWDKPVEIPIADVYKPDIATLDLSSAPSPLADVALSGSTSERPAPTGSIDDGPGLVTTQGSAFPGAWLCSFVSIDALQEHFDVSTDEVRARIMAAAVPYKVDSEPFRSKPDFWGPFWVATTAILFLAGSANFSHIMDVGSEIAKTDYSLAGAVATMIYGMAIAVPLGVRAAQYLLGSSSGEINYKQLICAFGYSLFVFIPVSIVCVAPVGLVKTLAILVALAWSLAFLYATVWVDLSSSNPKFKLVTWAIIAGAHVVICCYCRFSLFARENQS